MQHLHSNYLVTKSFFFVVLMIETIPIKLSSKMIYRYKYNLDYLE